MQIQDSLDERRSMGAAPADARFASPETRQEELTGMRTGAPRVGSAREASSRRRIKALEREAATDAMDGRDANTNSLFTHQHDGGEVSQDEH